MGSNRFQFTVRGSSLCHPSPCHVNAACATDSALPSGFTCTCNPPYIGDGFACQGNICECIFHVNVVCLAVIFRFEHSEYSITEEIGDRDLALQICLIVEDSPLFFDVGLTADESDGKNISH